jgi:lipopolysaccharide transport system ATP-binding protein
MSDIAIRAENLGKRYRIGQREPYKTLRDVVTDAFTAPFRRWRKQNFSISQSAFGDPKSDYIWALKDVSFEIKQGEVVGIIGRNGSGKTTLLKILSRTTEPTEGYAEIYGRVGSLLEVGTGFHPELTGRENIYLNAAILGMKRREIDRKFDEIVAFAETEKFLDTPVKRYSSGMHVRLAFAVAAYLEPEILLVDEVLAVGDTQFQKKCLGKMGDVAKGGRTVLFVSHQMGAIAQLCSKAFLLSKGNIAKAGDTQPVIDYYLSDTLSASQNEFTAGANCEKDMFVTKAQALNSEGDVTSHFSHQEKIIVAISYKINKWISDVNIGFFVRDTKGRRVFTTETREWDNVKVEKQELYVTVTIPSNFLVPGQYLFTFFVSVPRIRFVDWVEDVLSITIVDTGSRFLMYEGGDYGCVFAECKWNVRS